jgi:hypothetical protein
MKQTGILLHVRHIDTEGWERLMWGEPAADRFGYLPMLVWLLLNEPRDEPVTKVLIGRTIGCEKDGLNDAAYTKRFFVERFDQLREFPRLAQRLRALSDTETQRLRKRIENIEEMPELRNTMDEVTVGAKIFAERGIDKVVQLTAANHAPRCIQAQSQARAEGVIAREQIWSVVADDTCFEGANPLTTLILEPPHRGDDPMLGVKPSAPEVLRSYLHLSGTAQLQFVKEAQKLIVRLKNQS